MKNWIINILERVLGRQIARRTPDRGADLFANIDEIYGKNNFRVVFDVGANVGQAASVYREEFPSAKIFAFEPVSKTFKELETNLGGTGGVQLFQLGFGSEKSIVTINSLPEDSKMSSILFKVGPDTESVEIQTLDDFVKTHEVGMIDLLKIDTEGYELEVLKGAHDLLRNQRIGMLYIEAGLMKTDRHFLTVEELSLALNGYGYEVFGVYEQQPGFWTEKHSILFCNVLFIAPKLVPRQVNPDTYPFRAGKTHKV